MGCVSSKRDINDRHPNVFHVWNVDELGNMLVPGQIEITDNELVLYQKGKEAIRWPMRCLRRYGFDAELFSFESGRRCATGPGIYAFKCGRAEALFNLLQEHIQNSGQDDTSHASHTIGTHVNTGTVMVMSATAPGSNGGSNLRSGSVSVSDVGNYLEPIIRHRTRSNASRDGFSRMATQSLPSNLAFSDNSQPGVVAPSIPNGTNINASPHYVNGDLNTATNCERDRGSGSLSTRSPLTPPANLTSLHEYANTTSMPGESDNSPVFVKSALMDQTTTQLPGVQELTTHGNAAEASTSDKLLYSILDFHKNIVGVMKGSNGCRQMVLRGHSLDDNTNYAKLDDLLKQEHSAQQHLYMNVVPDGAQKKKDNCSNFMSSKSYSCRDHFYANVGPHQTSIESTPSGGAPLSCLTKENSDRQSQHHHSQSLPNHAISRQVNYAVLDLNHRGSNSSGGSASMAPSNGVGGSETAPTSPTSLITPPELTDNCILEGYATIDFNKTAALSNSANPRIDDDESVRMTRHDRNIISDPHYNKHSSIIGE